MLVVDPARGAKINELDNGVILVLEMDVLRLDVAVHDRLLMQIVDGRDELADDVGCLDLIEGAVVHHSLVERATMHHLVDEVDLFLVLVHLNDLPDVGMVKALEQLNFVEELPALAEFEVLLPDDLDGASDA